jgi:hypothetical protein
MKYLFLQLFIVFLSAMFLLFLFQQKDFIPFDNESTLNWYNIVAVLFFLFLVVQGFVSILFFLGQKFLTCGIREFPNISFSLKWGILISVLMIFVVIMNIFHILNLVWGISVAGLIVFLLLLTRF